MSRYHPVDSPAPPKLVNLPEGAHDGHVEMVTVPTLGPEWKASELRELTGKISKEERRERQALKWKEWRRGERGMCGRYFTKKFTAWFVFGLCVACVAPFLLLSQLLTQTRSIGVVLVFTIPRVPGFEFNSVTPLVPATGSFNSSVPVIFSPAPANFSFPAFADLQLDTNNNFLSVSFHNVHGTVYDLQTGQQVATGDSGHFSVPAKKFSQLQLPLNFTYIAINNTDQTCKSTIYSMKTFVTFSSGVNWHNACKNKGTFSDGNRPRECPRSMLATLTHVSAPALQFRLVLDIVINGLIGHHSAGTQVNDAPCPIELALNAS